jgi:hypothetical protein
VKAVWNDASVLSAVQLAEDAIIEDACELVTQKAKDSMVAGTGRMWRSKRPGGGMHQASIPGVPPAPDTEELKDSISYATSSGKSGGLGPASQVGVVSSPASGQGAIGHVGTQEEKGLWHELGTSINPDKRPFLRPALYASEDEILNLAGKHKI